MPRPRTVFCYICQREFGTASISIHEKQCLKKWHDENDRLPKNQRKPEPVKPTGFTGVMQSDSNETRNGENKTGSSNLNIDAYNEAAVKAAQANMVACKKCGRRFNTDRVQLHEAHCHPPRPKQVVYEARKPDFDEAILRTPLSASSVVGVSRAVAGPSSKSEHTVASIQTSTDSGLIRCRHCNRTFAKDRIERHEANCRAPPLKQNRANPPPTNSPKAFISPKLSLELKCTACKAPILPDAKFCSACGKPTQGNVNNEEHQGDNHLLRCSNIRSESRINFGHRQTVVCYICGREYGTMSITLHEPKCLNKWTTVNNRMPPSQRLPHPQRPVMSSKGFNLNAYNRAALIASSKNVSTCRGLSATFVANQLPVYVKSCMPR